MAAMDEAKLRERLWQLELDHDGSSLPFSRRLARDNGWSRDYADRAVEEYRRFVYLAAVAGHPVTPSDEVDQVWHLHLCYTRSYWDEMCGEILGMPLHHGPTRGGKSERAKFDDWYRCTLASYERVFGEQPPRELWPEPAERFAVRQWRRVDVGDTWLVSRARVQRQAMAVVAVFGLLLVAGCSSMLGDNVGGTIAVLSLFGVGGLIFVLIRSGTSKGAGGPGSQAGTGCGGGDGAYHGMSGKNHDGDDGGDGGHGGDGGGGGDSGCGGGGCGGGGCGGGCGG